MTLDPAVQTPWLSGGKWTSLSCPAAHPSEPTERDCISGITSTWFESSVVWLLVRTKVPLQKNGSSQRLLINCWLSDIFAVRTADLYAAVVALGSHNAASAASTDCNRTYLISKFLSMPLLTAKRTRRDWEQGWWPWWRQGCSSLLIVSVSALVHVAINRQCSCHSFIVPLCWGGLRACVVTLDYCCPTLSLAITSPRCAFHLPWTS